MKRLAFMLAAALLLLLIGSPVPAIAAEAAVKLMDSIDIDGLTGWAREYDAGIDVMDMLGKLARGEAELSLAALWDAIKSLALSEMRSAVSLVLALALPALLAALVRGVGGESGAASVAGFICTLTVAAQLIALFERMAAVAESALRGMGALTERVYPILSALLAAGGKGAASALFTPIAAMAGALSSTVIARWAVPVALIAAALTIAGHLSERMTLSALTTLIRKGFSFALAALLIAFTAILSIQGLLSRGYDGASIQTARFAASSLLPIVGGEVADSLDALLASAGLVRNAVGVTGLMLLVGALLKPVVAIAMHLIAVRMTGALIEPVAPGHTGKLIERFADVVAMLLAAVVAGAVLLIVLIGAALSLFG